MKASSIKHRKIVSTLDEDDDHFESLIKISRTAYTPGPTGTKVHMSLARTRIMRGGLGSGKSRCATEHVNAQALRYPGSRYVIARKDLTSLKETTQKEFLEKVVDSATVSQFNVNDNKLYYKNGSEVLFRETKDPDKFKSLELTGFLIDECDENETAEAYEKLDERLRQTLLIEGVKVEPPYFGLLVFNPTPDDHWLAVVANRTDIDVTDFRFDTYENVANLPGDYIPNLLRRLPSWDVNRLVHGHWGRSVKGFPVIHGFKRETHVRPFGFVDYLPLLRGWDFGFNHPAVLWAQIDPVVGRIHVHREFLGDKITLQDTAAGPGVVTKARQITEDLCGPTHPVFDYGDPHGNDKKDVGTSSIEYLRIHHNIHVISRREIIRTGLDELQHKVSTDDYLEKTVKGRKKDPTKAPLLVVHPMCKNFIAALEGGYQRDEHGIPIKDGFFDHLVDVSRYILVNNMNAQVKLLHQQRKYKPSNRYTGY